jgi:hypothetical protein
MANLEDAIGWNEQALRAAPDDYPCIIAVLRTLSKTRIARFERIDRLQDLERAC